jgi:hypothetical protein
LLVLHRPASRFQFLIDRFPGVGFEFCIWRDQLNHSLSLRFVIDIADGSSLIDGQS